MRRAAGTGLVRVLLALLSGAAVVLGLAPPPPANAAEPPAAITITLTSMTPALPGRDDELSFAGRVTNTSEGPVSNLQAILWRSSDPILDPESMTRALESQADDPIGRRLFDRDYQNIPSEQDRTLDPGESTTFTLTTAMANLDLPQADGVYLVGVHVRGRTAEEPLRDQTLGRTRTLLPLVDEPPAEDLQLTSLVVLRSRPSQLRPGVLLDDHLAQEVAPRGRLTRLLESAGSGGVSFAVDPALVQELETMRSGYTVDPGDGDPTPGRGQADATRWLQRFGQLSGAHDGFQLLFGSPDVAALAHDRQTAVLKDALAAGRRVTTTARLPLLVLPADGQADEATLRAAEQLKPAAVLLSDQSAVGTGPLLQGRGNVPVVRYGSGSSGGGGPGPDPRDTAVQVRQRVLADTWIEASQATDGTTRGRVRLVSDVNQMQGEDAGVEAPWLSRTTLSDLLDGTPAPWDGELTYPEEARAAELTPGQLGAERRLAKSYRTYAELLVDPTPATTAGAAAVARAASVSWRQQEQLRLPYVEQQQDVLDSVLEDLLRISTNPKVSTIAREGVEFPITIENRLPADADDPEVNAVKLRLVFVSENRQRLTISPIEAPLIPAEGTFPARARVTAKANGTVTVSAQLQTLDGTPVGEARRIDVRVTQNGTTGWAIAAAALVLFGGGTALRVRQVGKARAATDGEATAPSSLSSAPPTDAPGASRPLPPETDRNA